MLEARTFYKFIDLSWEPETNRVRFIFDGCGVLVLSTEDFPSHPGPSSPVEAPFMLRNTDGTYEHGLYVQDGQRIIILENPLVLALYDWLSWTFPTTH